MQKSRIEEENVNFDIIKNEINIHSRLAHENIIKVYSSNEDDNNFYLVIKHLTIDNGLRFKWKFMPSHKKL